MEANGLNSIEFDYKVDTKDLSTLRISGIAKGIFYPKNEKEFVCVYEFLNRNNFNFEIIGNGSNILFSPKAKDILLISTKKLKQNIKIKDNFLFCSSSITLAKAYQFAFKNSLSGFEQLANIPGTLGGALKMNAGAFGKTIFDLLEYVRVYKEGEIKNLKKNQIKYGYRYTNLEDCLILGAKFKLAEVDKCSIQENYISYTLERREKQPVGFSIGSIFKNPTNFSAGYLIDSCGLKGLRHNGAKISEKHANIIINEGGATYADIMFLIETCEKAVKEKYGIELEKEIKII